MLPTTTLTLWFENFNYHDILVVLCHLLRLLSAINQPPIEVNLLLAGLAFQAAQQVALGGARQNSHEELQKK
jgi:hypothetical protein